MSNTPETDAESCYPDSNLGECVCADFARKLERERDEAQEKINRQANRILYLEGATNHACGTPLSVALRERDEAREEIKEWKTLCLWGGTPEHIHGFIRGQQSRIQHLERERDEALFLLKAAQSALDAIHLEVGGWIKIMKENTD